MGKRGIQEPDLKTINWDEFDKLISYQCTQEEIAAFFDMSVDTLDRLCIKDRGQKLAELWDKKKFLGRVKLKKIQFKIAESGGQGAAAMAIFLGKTILGQSDLPKPPEINPIKSTYIKSFEQYCHDSGYPKPYPKQIEMMNFVIADDDEPRLLLGARGYGKTDIPEIMGVSYDIYCKYMRGEFTSYLIVTKSRGRSSAIVSEMANALLANGVELETHNATSIRVKGQVGKDDTIEAFSLKMGMRSRHPKCIIMDDPVNEDDTSEAQRLLVKKKYDEAYKLCKNIVIIGQPAHKHDLYSELRPILKKMEVPHGSIPELDADLEAMKLAGIDPISISMSYHLKIPAEGVAIFGDLKYIDSLPRGNTVAYIDPSDGGDYTAVTIFMKYFDGIAIEGRAWKKAWFLCLDEMIPYLVSRGVKKLAFETNATGSQPIIQLRQALAQYQMGVVGIHSTSNKHAVIQAAGSYSHMIHLSLESDKVYTDQVTKYEYKAKHDDAPDSLARGLVWLGLIRDKT